MIIGGYGNRGACGLCPPCGDGAPELVGDGDGDRPGVGVRDGVGVPDGRFADGVGVGDVVADGETVGVYDGVTDGVYLGVTWGLGVGEGGWVYGAFDPAGVDGVGTGTGRTRSHSVNTVTNSAQSTIVERRGWPLMTTPSCRPRRR